VRVLALDHGEGRCGCAVSDPTGTIATPLPEVERPDSRAGMNEIAGLVDDYGVARVVVGLPLTLKGEEGHQAARARVFAEALQRRVSVEVELLDERLTTKLAEQRGGGAGPDSRAAAHLLESGRARPAAAAE